MTRKWLMMIVATITISLTACNNNVYDKYHHTPVAGWEKNDVLTFNVPKFKTKGDYNLQLGLRINNSYPFMGATLIVSETVFPGKKVYTDTINCNLIEKNGKPRGKGLSYYQYNFPIKECRLNEGDSLHIIVRHDMKREILPGISDVGITISRIRRPKQQQ